MANQNDVRRIALSFTETSEDEGHFAFSVNRLGKQKGFAWIWMERVYPKKTRVFNLVVLTVRVRDTQGKERLIATEPEIFLRNRIITASPRCLSTYQL